MLTNADWSFSFDELWQRECFLLVYSNGRLSYSSGAVSLPGGVSVRRGPSPAVDSTSTSDVLADVRQSLRRYHSALKVLWPELENQGRGQPTQRKRKRRGAIPHSSLSTNMEPFVEEYNVCISQRGLRIAFFKLMT